MQILDEFSWAQGALVIGRRPSVSCVGLQPIQGRSVALILLLI